MTKCIRVFLIVMSVFFIPNFVFAQDADAGAPDGGADAGTLTPVGACFAACERLAASLPEDDDTDGNALMARCETELPECSALDSTVREALPSFCDRVVGHHGHGALPYETTPPAPEPPPAFCVLPTGTDADTGRHRCGCPAGTYPLRVSRERSADRLRSLHVPAGHAVFVCYNPLAAPGTPGSGDERFAAVERAVTDTTAALERLCEPHEGESLPDACARAADRWNTIGSTAGPVDLDPIMHAIEGLQHNAEAQQAVIDHLVDDSRALQTATLGNSDAIEGVSRRVASRKAVRRNSTSTPSTCRRTARSSGRSRTCTAPNCWRPPLTRRSSRRGRRLEARRATPSMRWAVPRTRSTADTPSRCCRPTVWWASTR